MTYGFEELALAEVHATVARENRASLALLERRGFVRMDESADGEGEVTVLLTCSRDSFTPR